jgi:hypothetical protein
MANAQMPAAAFDAPVAAGRDKPSDGIVATTDRARNLMLARWPTNASEQMNKMRAPVRLYRALPQTGTFGN